MATRTLSTASKIKAIERKIEAEKKKKAKKAEAEKAKKTLEQKRKDLARIKGTK